MYRPQEDATQQFAPISRTYSRIIQEQTLQGSIHLVTVLSKSLLLKHVIFQCVIPLCSLLDVTVFSSLPTHLISVECVKEMGAAVVE